MDVPVLPRSHDLACLLARRRREQLAESVPSVGAGHELSVVSDRTIRHHDKARLAVVEDLGAVAALATVVRSDEHIDTLEETPDVRVLEQCKPTSPFEVPSENERDAADVEEREQAQIVRIGERRIVVAKNWTWSPAG